MYTTESFDYFKYSYYVRYGIVVTVVRFFCSNLSIIFTLKIQIPYSKAVLVCVDASRQVYTIIYLCSHLSVLRLSTSFERGKCEKYLHTYNHFMRSSLYKRYLMCMKKKVNKVPAVHRAYRTRAHFISLSLIIR